jgi:hypothetical protein
VNTAEYNHQAVGIRACENAFHLASTILGGRDIIEEFVAARIWSISHGWSPNEIVCYNVNWASQEVPFLKFGVKLVGDQSADDFMLDVKNIVALMIGEYTMNEYKAYKALVKHRRKINRVFSEICGDKAFPSRCPGRKVKVPAVAVASCSAAPISAPRKKSLKRGASAVDEGATSGVKPSKTRSLESSKRKRKTSEPVLDAELQAAFGLAQMSRKKLKKAVKKVASSGVRRVPSAFDDDPLVEAASQKGSYFCPLLGFNFRDEYPSGSESEFVDIDSFSDAAPEVRKDAVLDVVADAPVAAATAADVSLPVHSRDDASPEFTKELELTVHRGEDPVPNAPLVEVREVIPEGQAPSPSLAAFNESFGTSHRGELLSVGFETTNIRRKTSKILTLWKSHMLVDETGGEGSEQTGGVARDSGKGPHSALRKASSSQGKTSSGSTKKVTMQNLSKQGSFLFIAFYASRIFEYCAQSLVTKFSRIQGPSSFVPFVEAGAVSRRLRSKTFYARESCCRTAR